ncbi:MAG: family 43 glycosylhydrolase [Candidatus Saccharibacteria bacterium]
MKKYTLTLILLAFAASFTFAQNPVIRDQYSADPTARVFNGKVYLYPSHDILGKPGQGRPNWFCMEDYHVFSSENLTDWKDHGMILSQTTVPWANPKAYSMWAPDCIERNGKYYFYFPTAPDSTYGRGFAIGVAVADRPEGPYTPQSTPIKKVMGIDPNVFIDKDGQAYLYWAMGNIFGAKLKENMLELASEPVVIGELPGKGLKEGPFLFERDGIYYMTIPHVEKNTERLEYYTGTSPLGPFKFGGVIMDESPVGCWTNHHSFINYNNQWYLFYHHNDYSPKFDKNRSVRIDSMFFNTDGSIRKVIPTLRGVGLTKASSEIQLDRFSRIADKGVTIAFNDSTNTFKGWKTVFKTPGAWVQYNSVDFEKGKFKTMEANVYAANGGTFEVHLDKADGPVIAVVKVPKGESFSKITSKAPGVKNGVHNLYVVSKDNSVEVDWIRFQ